jgi:hypothetical protein
MNEYFAIEIGLWRPGVRTEFLIYRIAEGRSTIAADGLHDLEEARLFAQYLAVYGRIPPGCFRVVAANVSPPAQGRLQ